MAGSVDEHLAFDIGFALPRSPIKGLRRALTEDERRVMAKAIVEHLRLCGWEFRLGHGAVGVVKRPRLGDLEDTMTTEQRGPDPQQPRTRARTRSDTAQRRA